MRTWAMVLFTLLCGVLLAMVAQLIVSCNTTKYSQDTPTRYCIDGHEFFSMTANSFGAGFAQHIGDDGLPVKCKVEEVER